METLQQKIILKGCLNYLVEEELLLKSYVEERYSQEDVIW
jgi:hypothetical protein